MSNNRKEKALKAAVDTLLNYYDTCQIFCTKYKGDENDSTQGQVFGKGNLFARIAHIELWLERVHMQLLDIDSSDNGEQEV